MLYYKTTPPVFLNISEYKFEANANPFQKTIGSSSNRIAQIIKFLTWEEDCHTNCLINCLIKASNWPEQWLFHYPQRHKIWCWMNESQWLCWWISETIARENSSAHLGWASCISWPIQRSSSLYDYISELSHGCDKYLRGRTLKNSISVWLTSVQSWLAALFEGPW